MYLIFVAVPELEDEIELNVGDLVEVKEDFDDGWAVGVNVSTGKVGAFPKICLEILSEQDRDALIKIKALRGTTATTFTKRTSSVLVVSKLLKSASSPPTLTHASSKPPIGPHQNVSMIANIPPQDEKDVEAHTAGRGSDSEASAQGQRATHTMSMRTSRLLEELESRHSVVSGYTETTGHLSTRSRFSLSSAIRMLEEDEDDDIEQVV
jgi:hypothetical protein